MKTTNLFNEFNDIVGHMSSYFDEYSYVPLKDGKLILDIPGVKKEDLELIIENGYLFVKGKRHDTERLYSQKFYVGRKYENEDIKAKLEDGVLTILFPKKMEKTESSKIVVE